LPNESCNFAPKQTDRETMKALMIAAPSSGAGRTTVSRALIHGHGTAR